MTSLPPEAAGAAGGAQGATGGATGEPPPSSHRPLSAASLPAAAPRPEGGARPAYGPRLVPPVRPSDAPVELTLDLRATPPDKVIARLIGALDRVSPDVTLYVLLRDTPEYVGVTASIYQALRSRGYVSDSSRLPQGGQRLCVRRRRESPRPVFRTDESPDPDAAELTNHVLAD